MQHYRTSITEMTDADIESTFETNILGYMHMAKVRNCDLWPAERVCC